MFRKSFSVLIFSLFILALFYQANISASTSSFANFFELTPALNISAFGETKEFFNAQILLPILSDAEKVLFIDMEGNGSLSQKGWMLGMGGGFRKIFNDRIIGGYLLFDYNSTATYEKVLIINPGFENLGEIWNFRGNVYFPTLSKINQQAIQYGFASDFGITDYVHFSGHQQFDRLATIITDTSINFARGGDFEIGRTLPKFNQIQAYIGGYHFDTSNAGSINGLSGRLNYKINEHFSLEAKDTYDNYKKNTFLLGVNIKIGGVKGEETKDFGLSKHLLEPIQHNIASMANGSAVIQKTQTGRQTSIGAQNVLAHDNIWFVRTNLSKIQELAEDGTYENPFSNINQKNIDVIQTVNPKGARIYLASGNYVPSVNANQSNLVLGEGISIFGRNADYKCAANKDERAQILGSLFLSGNNILDSLRLEPTGRGDYIAIIIAKDADQVQINNTNIGNASANNFYNIGILADSVKKIVLSNSNIYVHSVGSDNQNDPQNAYGIYFHHVDNLIVDNSSINAIAKDSGDIRHSGNAYGILIGYDVYDHPKSGQEPAFVHNNSITIKNSSSIIASGNSTGGVDDAGNGYAMLIGYGYGWSSELQKGLSVTNNSIKLLNDETNMQSNILQGIGNNSGTYGFVSGNGYGLLIGYATLGNMTSNKQIDFDIAGNKVSIYNSSLNGSGLAGEGTIAGGNGYGLLVGYGYNESSTTFGEHSQEVSFSIQNNVIDIYSSQLKGKGFADVYTKNSGNGYGLLVGANYEQGISMQDSPTLFNVQNNTININNSILNGVGKSGDFAEYSGNGYGLLLGYGYEQGEADLPVVFQAASLLPASLRSSCVSIYTPSARFLEPSRILEMLGSITSDKSRIFKLNESTSFNVKNNVVLALNSSFLGTGEAGNYFDESHQFGGNGYGMLIGYNYAILVSDQVPVTVEVSNNLIDIKNSTFNGIGFTKENKSNFVSGNGEGLAIGYGYMPIQPEESETDTIHFLANNNTVKLTNSNLTALANGNFGAAYAMNIGQNADNMSEGSIIQATDNYFTSKTTGNNQYAYAFSIIGVDTNNFVIANNNFIAEAKNHQDAFGIVNQDKTHPFIAALINQLQEKNNFSTSIDKERQVLNVSLGISKL